MSWILFLQLMILATWIPLWLVVVVMTPIGKLVSALTPKPQAPEIGHTTLTVKGVNEDISDNLDAARRRRMTHRRTL